MLREYLGYCCIVSCLFTIQVYDKISPATDYTGMIVSLKKVFMRFIEHNNYETKAPKMQFL